MPARVEPESTPGADESRTHVAQRPVVSGAIVVGAGATAWCALPLWPLIALVAVLIVARTAPRYGWTWALSSTMLVGTVFLYATSVLSAAFAVNFHAAMAVAVATVGVSAFVTTDTAKLRLPSCPTMAAIAVAPALWLTAAAIGVSRPGPAWDWALGGDSSNNVLFSRDIILHHGISVDGVNPVPLPHLLIALGMVGEGRHASAGDVLAYGIVWHLLIAATAGVAGLLGYVIATRLGVFKSGALALAAVAPGMCVLAWAVTGYAIEFGFINAHVALVIVLLALTSALAAPRASAGFVLQVVAAIVLLVTWSPLAVVPCTLAVVHGIAFIRLRSVKNWWSVGMASGAGLAYAAVLVSLQGENVHGAFGSAGGVLAPSARIVAVVLVCALVIGALLIRYRAEVGQWVIAMAAALGMALAGTVILAGGHWTYYPMKMAWFVAAIGGIVVVAAVAGVSTLVIPTRPQVAAGIVVVAVVAGIAGAPIVRSTTGKVSWVVEPISTVAWHDPGGSDDIYGAMVALDRDDHRTALLWRSGSLLENQVNFWVLNLASGRFSAELDAQKRFAVRQLAYLQLAPSDAQLCGIDGIVGTTVVVYTVDQKLQATLTGACGGDAPDIQVIAPGDANLAQRVRDNQ